MELVTVQRHARHPARKFLGHLRSHSTPNTELNLRQHSLVDESYVCGRELEVLTAADQACTANPDRSLLNMTSSESKGAKVCRVKDPSSKEHRSFPFIRSKRTFLLKIYKKLQNKTRYME